jgi:ABC-type transport system involved in cytochrome bd biosynthesis fused ATPase/permease subunit
MEGWCSSRAACLASLLLTSIDSQISGGQRQRVAIARMIVRNNALIYILDEPFTGLDPITEKQVMEGLEPSLDGKTVIHIT